MSKLYANFRSTSSLIPCVLASSSSRMSRFIFFSVLFRSSEVTHE